MSKVAIFMADGCEEIEGLTVVDILRRVGIEIDMVSVTGKRMVTSSHKVSFETDILFEEADFAGYDAVVLPGGMPGTTHLLEHEGVVRTAKEFNEAGKLVAAICAAPSVLGLNHLLEGKKATCHPGFEDKLLGAIPVEEPVVVDSNIITSRGMGTAIEFALAIVEYLEDKEKVEKVKTSLVYRGW